MKNYLSQWRDIFPQKEKPQIISTYVYETESINKKSVDEIDPRDFLRDEFRWLTIEGFHYYFPALIRCSLEDLEACLCKTGQIFPRTTDIEKYFK